MPVHLSGIGLGAKILNTSSATDTNKKLAAKYGWSVKSGSGYSGVGDPDLAEDLYCYQHEVENCDGTCTPGSSKAQCINRDGMLGERTLQELANDIAANNARGQVWKSRINVPQKYMALAGSVPPPPSDTASWVPSDPDYQQMVEDYENSLTDDTDSEFKVNKAGFPIGMMLLMTGGLSLGAIAIRKIKERRARKHGG